MPKIECAKNLLLYEDKGKLFRIAQQHNHKTFISSAHDSWKRKAGQKGKNAESKRAPIELKPIIALYNLIVAGLACTYGQTRQSNCHFRPPKIGHFNML